MLCLFPVADPSTTSVIIENLKAFLPPIAAITVGCAAFIVSLQQVRTAKFQADIAKAKLNLDLFEKRYLLFETTWGFLSNPDNDYRTNRPKFTNEIPKASFLFGSDVEEYMKEISKNAVDLHVLTVKHNARNILAEEIARMSTLENWFISEASTGVKAIFGKYMNFSNWKS